MKLILFFFRRVGIKCAYVDEEGTWQSIRSIIEDSGVCRRNRYVTVYLERMIK